MTWILKQQDNNKSIELHEQYWWRDEYDWTPIAKSDPVYTLSGAMDIQEGVKKAGRPITLDATYARIMRKDVEILQEWAALPELEMTLTHPDGRVFNVTFARQGISDVVEVKLYKARDKSSQDKLRANINLIEI